MKTLIRISVWLIVNGFLPVGTYVLWQYLEPSGFWEMFAMIAGTLTIMAWELGLIMMSTIVLFWDSFGKKFYSGDWLF